MSEKTMLELKDKLCRELDEINRHQELTQGMVDNAHKLTASIKNLDKILMYDKFSSEDGGYRGYRDYSYDNGYSGRRGRDSMGRYTSRGDVYDGRSWGEVKDTMIQQLSDMLSMTGNAREKEIVRRARDELKEM